MVFQGDLPLWVGVSGPRRPQAIELKFGLSLDTRERRDVSADCRASLLAASAN